MKILIIFFTLLATTYFANAQDTYDVSTIDKSLLTHARAVIRNKEVNIEVKDLDNTLCHIKEAITVLNKNGDDFAHMAVEHDKANIIKNIKGTVYNSFGKQIGKFSEGDFDDVSAYDGFSLFTDTRIKHYLPSVTEYPYTIAYEYETKSKQSLAFDDWDPNPALGIAVEKSSYTFICKPDFNIRYKEINVPNKVSIATNTQGMKTYTWQVSNLKAIKDEPYSPYNKNYLTSVKIAPEKFTYYGISGSYTDWKGFGKWIYDDLVANRQELPAETVEHIKEITKDISDPKLKAKKIYEYMQSKTHYISVQIGIGGWQPFLASDVDKQNYGDCKALVNYTQALLKAVNINSYYCVVEAGRDHKVSLLSDFASITQGNHIILCLPFKNDTTWADCTSETIPFGYLGSFTDDRLVLACTPEGGKLMRTPKYTADENLESRKANFVISETGELSGVMTTTFKGADYEYRERTIGESPKERDKILKGIYPINNFEIEKLDLKQDKTEKPVTTEAITLTARDYASVADGKYYFLLNPVNRITEHPHEVLNRINSVYINRGYTDEDEITYTIPKGYKLEKIPLDVNISKPFAKFNATMTLKDNRLIYKRKFQMIDGTYSKDTYQELVDFFQDVVDADSYSVVLIKN